MTVLRRMLSKTVVFLITISIAARFAAGLTQPCVQCRSVLGAFNPPYAVGTAPPLGATYSYDECGSNDSSVVLNKFISVTSGGLTCGQSQSGFACYSYWFYNSYSKNWDVTRGCIPKPFSDITMLPSQQTILAKQGWVCYANQNPVDKALLPTCYCNTDNCNTWGLPNQAADGTFSVSATPSNPTSNTGSSIGGNPSSGGTNPSGGTNTGGTNTGGTNGADNADSNDGADPAAVNKAGSGGTNGGVDPSASSTSGPPVAVSPQYYLSVALCLFSLCFL